MPFGAAAACAVDQEDGFVARVVRLEVQFGRGSHAGYAVVLIRRVFDEKTAERGLKPKDETVNMTLARL